MRCNWQVAIWTNIPFPAGVAQRSVVSWCIQFCLLGIGKQLTYDHTTENGRLIASRRQPYKYLNIQKRRRQRTQSQSATARDRQAGAGLGLMRIIRWHHREIIRKLLNYFLHLSPALLPRYFSFTSFQPISHVSPISNVPPSPFLKPSITFPPSSDSPQIQVRYSSSSTTLFLNLPPAKKKTFPPTSILAFIKDIQVKSSSPSLQPRSSVAQDVYMLDQQLSMKFPEKHRIGQEADQCPSEAVAWWASKGSTGGVWVLIGIIIHRR